MIDLGDVYDVKSMTIWPVTTDNSGTGTNSRLREVGWQVAVGYNQLDPALNTPCGAPGE